MVRLYADRTQQAAERVGADGTSDKMVLPYTQWLWERMDHDLGPSPSVLFIGGGGYSLPAKLIQSRLDARALAVEIDPLITQVVRDHLPWAGAMIRGQGVDGGAETGDRRLGIVHADGRVYLNETQQTFDAAIVDAFSSGAVPAHLATREAYERLRNIVQGPVYVNLIDSPDGPLARGVHAILVDLYPFVGAVQGPVSDRGQANIILVAGHRPFTPLATLPERFAEVSITSSRAFTDDRGWIGHR